MADLKLKPTWFVRVTPFGLMPWSWKGWLWFFLSLGGVLEAGFKADLLAKSGRSPDSQIWMLVGILIFVTGFIVAFAKSRKI